MSLRMSVASLWSLIVCFFLGLAGCGNQETGPDVFFVTGTVAIDGRPLGTGKIQFRSGGNGRAYVGAIEDGQFSLDAEAGTSAVAITASRPTGKYDEGASPEDEPQPIMEMYIPVQYNSQTTLTAEVSPDGMNMFPFELQVN